ncbi:hypothetical protein D3C81_343470 [compost metagenome]
MAKSDTAPKDNDELLRRWMMLLVACLLLALAGWGQYHKASLKPISITLELAASSTSGQVFYRGDNSYSEARSLPLQLQADAELHTYRVEIPSKRTVKAIRLDVGNTPGDATVQSLVLLQGATEAKLAGPSLRASVLGVNQLQLLPPSNDALQLVSTGTDPYIEFAVPDVLTQSLRAQKVLANAALGLGVLGLAVLAWFARHLLAESLRRLRPGRGTGLTVAALAGILALLALLGSGCDGLCSPRGIAYGSALLLASLGFTVVGFALLSLVGWKQTPGRPALFLALVTGQATLVLYVLLRSVLQDKIGHIPLTGIELFVLVAASAAYLVRTRLGTAAWQRYWTTGRWLPLELGLLSAVCIAIGDRELPRIVMLSSDPDTHAYFARQIELLGGIPWAGGDLFNYPAGTGVLGFLWAKLSLLDVRNSVTALPLLQAFTATLVIAEALALTCRRSGTITLIFATALGITCAGLLIPMFSVYAHMEGAGRQMGIAFLAIAGLPLLPQQPSKLRHGRPIAIMVSLCLLTLAILNPINIVVPLILLAAFSLGCILWERRIPWLTLSPLLLILLLLLDPYYHQLLLGSGTSASRFTLSDELREIPGAEILHHWKALLLQGPWQFLQEFTHLIPGQKQPLFGLLLAMCALPWLLKLGRKPIALARVVLTAVFVLLSLWAADRLFATLLNDRRFYLLQPYFGLSLGQLKILTVTVLAATAPVALARHRLWKVALLAAVLVTLTFISMHRVQPMMESPRVDYCGSLGCASEDDLAVLEDVQRLWRQQELSDGYVLLPNSRHRAHNESWVFPVTGTRALPFYDGPPAAFYYYQGSEDFTTANYLAHVCERFDRDWLLAQGVRYVFLPSNRESACLDDMDALQQRAKVLARHGQSQFLELQ